MLQLSTTWWRAGALMLVVACQARPPAAAPPPTPVAPIPTAAPVADAAPPRASSPAAPIDQTCTTDADCLMTYDELTDSANAEACCGGCVARAVNRSWHARFVAACAAAPPAMCPPLGCADLPRVATCIAGGCVAASAP